MAVDDRELQWLKSHELTPWGAHVSQTMGDKKREPHQAYSLSGACAGVLNGHIAVIVGGKEVVPIESYSRIARLDLFDMNTNMWLTGYDIRGELSHRIGHSVVTLDKKAYTFGGEPLDDFKESQQQLKCKVFELSYENEVLDCTDVTPVSGKGTDPSVISSPAPCGRAWHASAAVTYRESKSNTESPLLKGMLVLGGKSSLGAFLADVWILIVNIPGQNPCWQQVMPTGSNPLPLAYHNAVAIGEGDKVVVFGGRLHMAINSSIHVLDLSTNTWSSIKIAGEEPGSSQGSRVLSARCCATALVLQLPIDEETGGIRRIRDGDLNKTACSLQEAIVIFGGFSTYEPALNPVSMAIIEPRHAQVREVQVPMAEIKSYMAHAIAVRSDRRGFVVFGGASYSEDGDYDQPQSFLDSTTALTISETPLGLLSEDEEKAQRQAAENFPKTKTLSNGDVYVGEMSVDETQRQGKGKCSYANGDEYQGDWRADQRSGQGVMRYASQQGMYTGQWESDQRHGFGIYEYGGLGSSSKEARSQHPKKYEGQWANNQKHGAGTLTFHSATQLVGVWANDVLDTRENCCLKQYDDGQNGICRYVGEVLDGVPHGYGESHNEVSKEVYKGSWRHGSRSGEGFASLRDGSTYRGQWRNGRRNGFGIFEDACTRAHYDGKWVGGVCCGRGVCKYANGCVYEGDWLNNERHGSGRYAFPNGSSYDGAWLHDKFCGNGSFILNIEDSS